MTEHVSIGTEIFSVVRQYLTEEYNEEYKVMARNRTLVEHLTYTQCLIYIGARLLGKAHQDAKGFALGFHGD